MAVHDHGSHCNNVCSGFGGRVCPDPANCNINPRPFPPQDPRPRPSRIEPPRLPDPPFIPAEPRVTIKPLGGHKYVLSDRAFIEALVEAVEVLESEAETWKAMFETLARGVQVDADQKRIEEALAKARKGLCWYAYLQDERCKLPEGHIGDHGPKHQCNVDCGLSPDGCTLPVPANPAAYYKALYWEIHGSSCPPTCRGHAS